MSGTTTDHTLNWAQHLASRGWAVFPLAPGTKRPAIKGWEHRATTDPERIKSCWHAGAGLGIGIATGPSRLVVLDLDPAGSGAPDGAGGLAALAAARGVQLAPTFTVATPRGGTHLYYRTPPGVRLRNTAGTLAPRVDTRADGGYVVAPGTILPNGGYELVDDTDPPELPAWLVQALTARPAAALSAPPERPCTDPGGYVGAAGSPGSATRSDTPRPGGTTRCSAAPPTPSASSSAPGSSSTPSRGPSSSPPPGCSSLATATAPPPRSPGSSTPAWPPGRATPGAPLHVPALPAPGGTPHESRRAQ